MTHNHTRTHTHRRMHSGEGARAQQHGEAGNARGCIVTWQPRSAVSGGTVAAWVGAGAAGKAGADGKPGADGKAGPAGPAGPAGKDGDARFWFALSCAVLRG